MSHWSPYKSLVNRSSWFSPGDKAVTWQNYCTRCAGQLAWSVILFAPLGPGMIIIINYQNMYFRIFWDIQHSHLWKCLSLCLTPGIWGQLPNTAQLAKVTFLTLGFMWSNFLQLYHSKISFECKFQLPVYFCFIIIIHCLGGTRHGKRQFSYNTKICTQIRVTQPKTINCQMKCFFLNKKNNNQKIKKR